jgi:hypothetical protein
MWCLLLEADLAGLAQGIQPAGAYRRKVHCPSVPGDGPALSDWGLARYCPMETLSVSASLSGDKLLAAYFFEP